jgi:hypothetical protein
LDVRKNPFYIKNLFLEKEYFQSGTTADDMIARGMMSTDHKTDNYRMQ